MKKRSIVMLAVVTSLALNSCKEQVYCDCTTTGPDSSGAIVELQSDFDDWIIYKSERQKEIDQCEQHGNGNPHPSGPGITTQCHIR